jgi:hypothetical protein
VGEDFLDIATLKPKERNLRLSRVDLRELSGAERGSRWRKQSNEDAVTTLGSMLPDIEPDLGGAIVLVDSPRWPSDLDWSQPEVVATLHREGGRELDADLRHFVAILREPGARLPLTPLSMFPTPPMHYFGAHLNTVNCKPHLRKLGEALFGEALNRDYGQASGGIFTRFMVSGFATYRALESLGAEVYESYPDLQFRLWCGGDRLISKKKGPGAALASRVRVLNRLARRLGVSSGPIRRLDEADAAILALSLAAARRYGAALILENSYEGRFVVAMDQPEATLSAVRLQSLA